MIGGSDQPIGLVLAAHGSDIEPQVNEQIRHLAAQLRGDGAFVEVRAAFHQGTPHFSAVLDEMDCQRVVVIPVMTSEGFYSDIVLQRELRTNAILQSGLTPVQLHVTGPVGTHSLMTELLARRMTGLCAAQAWDPSGTSVAIVGHGTRRHPLSRNATARHAELLRQRSIAGQVIAAFIDEEPLVEAVPRMAAHEKIAVLPFLIAPGPHATRDLPRRLGLMLPETFALPIRGRVGSKNVVCDLPVGVDPGLVDIVRASAHEACDLLIQGDGTHCAKSEFVA